MESNSNDGDFFILGTNMETSILDLCRMVCEIIGVDIQPLHGPRKPEDIGRMRYDYSKAHNALGWRPRTRLPDGLKLTIEWLQKDLRSTE